MPHSPENDSSTEFLPSVLGRLGKVETTTEFFSPVPDGYVLGRHKYVIVLGTVMSGLGKGIFSSSLAKLLKDKGLSVAPIKLEGYLNIDSGTLNPYRHGEVFVLDDGTETDMDLGTYERMLDQSLTRQNFCTSGQVYTDILERERRGGYLGRDVQMIPHVTGEVKLRIRNLALHGGPDGGPADVVFVEVGGTVGDYENSFYIEALRELAFEEGPNSACFVALAYVIEPESLGEQKSKAAQLGIRRLMATGIQPHLIACRAHQPVTETVKQKIAMFSNVPIRRVFSMHDRKSIYSIPEDMRAEGLDREILSILNAHDRVDTVKEDAARVMWRSYADRITRPRDHEVRVGVLGKYAALRDAYASIDKAIEHASTHLSARVEMDWIDTADTSSGGVDDRLKNFDAIIVPGGFGERGVEGKIAGVEYVRTHGIPYLGICLGFQVAVIEYARNIVGLAGANSTEFDELCPHPVISVLPEQKKIEGLGATMRLGAQDVILDEGSFARQLCGGATKIHERFRHRWEVDPSYVDQLTNAGLHFSGRHPKYPIMQMLELSTNVHPYFVAAQFHPELTSRPLRPQPLFMGLIANAIIHRDPDARVNIDARWHRTPSTAAASPDIETGPAGSLRMSFQA
jgi:CTP synthase